MIAIATTLLSVTTLIYKMAQTPTTEIHRVAAPTTHNQSLLPHSDEAHGGDLNKLQFDNHSCNESSSDQVLFIGTPSPPIAVDESMRVDRDDELHEAAFDGEAVAINDENCACFFELPP